MRLRVYEQLYRVNLHLVEAAREIRNLAKDLHADRTLVLLMTEQLDELRRDANGSFANLIHDREFLHRPKPTRNWRLHDLQQAKTKQ